MNFNYEAVTDQGEKKRGVVEAQTKDLAITALQRRGLIITTINEEGQKSGFLNSTVFERVPMKDVVILSRQISTLFEAQVSAVKAFSLMASSAENPLLRRTINQITEDIQAGYSISSALAKHPAIFSEFYVNMVHAGEESGKLNQVFLYLADYLDRQYALTTKTRNALIYPAFVIFVFFAVMGLMFTLVIPKLGQIIVDTGQEIPLYTKVVIGISNFLVDYGIFIIIAFIVAVGYVWYLSRTDKGKEYIDNVKISLPFIGPLFRKVYLSRIADNLDTMLSSGISIIRSMEITGSVVGSRTYKGIMDASGELVKGGTSLSDAFSRYPDHVPQIMVQMVKVGEETGSIPNILKTLAKFYKREVDEAVDTLIGMIEPAMIVLLGVSVGLLLASILVPIYNIASGIQ
jgi:type IV pilus assembly protein PilC